MLGDPGAASRAPRHRVPPVVDIALLMAALQELPDSVVVLVRHREIGVVPIHPVAEPSGLTGLDGRVLQNPLLAFLDERIDAISLDIPLRLEPQLLLDLDLDPQPLAVEA